MRPGLNNISYNKRLDKLGLFSLDRRRLQGAAIEVYKIMRGIDRIDSQNLSQGGSVKGSSA